MRNLNGKIVVLTGASSGIGRATALMLASKGAVLHLIARRKHLLEEVCEQARGLGGSATAHVLDVCDTDAITQMANHIHSSHGRVDVLINNAGIGAAKPFLETTDDDWQWTFNTNLFAIANAIRTFLPSMLEHGAGTIVNISSIAGVVGNPLTAYCASKAAVIGLSESLYLEYGAQGIEIVVVVPGVVATEIATASVEAGRVSPPFDTQADFLAKHGTKPEVIARDIVRAIQRPRFLVFSPTHAKVLRFFHSWFPGLTRTLLRRLGDE